MLPKQPKLAGKLLTDIGRELGIPRVGFWVTLPLLGDVFYRARIKRLRLKVMLPERRERDWPNFWQRK